MRLEGLETPQDTNAATPPDFPRCGPAAPPGARLGWTVRVRLGLLLSTQKRTTSVVVFWMA